MDLAVVSKSSGRPAARVEAFLNLSARSPFAIACGQLGRRRVPLWEELARFVSSSFAPQLVLTPPSSSPSVKILNIPLAVAFRLGTRPARAPWYVESRQSLTSAHLLPRARILISSSSWSLSCSLILCTIPHHLRYLSRCLVPCCVVSCSRARNGYALIRSRPCPRPITSLRSGSHRWNGRSLGTAVK